MKLPISIIIPTLNEEKYLPLLLDSIKNQSAKPKEIIIADSKSKDNTGNIAKLYDCKIVSGGLPAKARNNGAKIASESMLLFLDADIVLGRDFLKTAYKEIKSKKLDLASCFSIPLSSTKIDSIMFDSSSKLMKLVKKISPHAGSPCLFVKKSIHKEINGFDTTLTMGEDHDYVKRACKKGKYDFLKSVKVYVSIRRLKKEGRVKLVLKYALVEAHHALVGPVRKDLFKYEFGNYKQDLINE